MTPPSLPPDDEATAPASGGPAAAGRPEREGRELAAAHLDGLTDVVTVLRGQLDGVQTLTAEAAHGIVARTNGIDEQLRGLIGVLEQEAAHLLGRAVEEGLQLREEEVALRLLQHFLARSAGNAQGSEERVRLIGEAMASTAPVIAELRELAMQSKVLSINASVESARQRGAFGVIAEEVRNVSERSAVAVKQVEGAIARVAAVVGAQLSDSSRQEQLQDAADREQLVRFAAMVARRAGAQRERGEDHKRMLGSVAEQHDQLRARVVELLASVQFEDVTRQRVEGVRGALADMARVLQELGAALRAPAGWGQLPAVLDAERLLGGYVMAQQREAHASALGETAAADDLPKIELF